MAKIINPLRRYHYQVYLPENTSDMCLEFFNQLDYINVTYHAAFQMCDDSRCIIDLPTKQDLLNDTTKLVEFYEILDKDQKPTGTIQKMVLRLPHLNEKFDFTYLVAREGYIISAWCLEKTDVPRLTKTLYEYYCPSELKQMVYQKFDKNIRAAASLSARKL